MHINEIYDSHNVVLTTYTYKCWVGGAATSLAHSLVLDCHHTSVPVAKYDISSFVVVKEWPLFEPRTLETTQHCRLLPERTPWKFELCRLVRFVRKLRDLCWSTRGHR